MQIIDNLDFLSQFTEGGEKKFELVGVVQEKQQQNKIKKKKKKSNQQYEGFIKKEVKSEFLQLDQLDCQSQTMYEWFYINPSNQTVQMTNSRMVLEQTKSELLIFKEVNPETNKMSRLFLGDDQQYDF